MAEYLSIFVRCANFSNKLQSCHFVFYLLALRFCFCFFSFLCRFAFALCTFCLQNNFDLFFVRRAPHSRHTTLWHSSNAVYCVFCCCCCCCWGWHDEFIYIKLSIKKERQHKDSHSAAEKHQLAEWQQYLCIFVFIITAHAYYAAPFGL